MAAATRDDAAPLSLSSAADLPSFLQRNATRRNFVRNGSCTEAEKSATLARLWGWMGGGNNSNNNEEEDYDGDDREPARLPRYFLACEAASIILREPPSSSLAAERCPFYEADALRGILEAAARACGSPLPSLDAGKALKLAFNIVAGSQTTARKVFEDNHACTKLAGMFKTAAKTQQPQLETIALVNMLCAFIERLAATVPTTAVYAVFVSNIDFVNELLTMLEVALAWQERGDHRDLTLGVRLINVLYALSLRAAKQRQAKNEAKSDRTRDSASLLFAGKDGGASLERMCLVLVRILHLPDRADNSLTLRTAATTVLYNVLDAGGDDGVPIENICTTDRATSPRLHIVRIVRALIRLAEQWIVHYVVEGSPKTKMDSTLLPCVLVLLHLCSKEAELEKSKTLTEETEDAPGHLTVTLQVMLRMSADDFLKRSIIRLINPISSTPRVATVVSELVWICCGKDGQSVVQFVGAGAAAQILIQQGVLQLPGT